MTDDEVRVEQYSNVVALVNQADIAVAERNQQGALKAYTSALDIAQQLKRSRLIAVLNRRLCCKYFSVTNEVSRSCSVKR